MKQFIKIVLRGVAPGYSFCRSQNAGNEKNLMPAYRNEFLPTQPIFIGRALSDKSLAFNPVGDGGQCPPYKST